MGRKYLRSRGYPSSRPRRMEVEKQRFAKRAHGVLSHVFTPPIASKVHERLPKFRNGF